VTNRPNVGLARIPRHTEPAPAAELPAEPAEPGLPSSFDRHMSRLLCSADVPYTVDRILNDPETPLRNVGHGQEMHLRSDIEQHLGRALTWADVDRAWSHLGIRSPSRFPRNRDNPRP
jgi:hypothetical protein